MSDTNTTTFINEKENNSKVETQNIDIDISIIFTDNNEKNDKVETKKNNCDFKGITDLSISDGIIHYNHYFIIIILSYARDSNMLFLLFQILIQQWHLLVKIETIVKLARKTKTVILKRRLMFQYIVVSIKNIITYCHLKI